MNDDFIENYRQKQEAILAELKSIDQYRIVAENEETQEEVKQSFQKNAAGGGTIEDPERGIGPDKVKRE